MPHTHSPLTTTTQSFKAQCHCHRSALSFTIPISSLPLPAHFCHCSICRYTHGTLFSTHAPIPAPDVDLSTLTSYQSSEHVVKYFCQGCGSHMLDRVDGAAGERGNEKWFIAVGLVDGDGDNGEDRLWRFGKHIFVEGTVDGGLAVLMDWIDGVKVKSWNERPVDDPAFADAGDWRLDEAAVEVIKSSDREEGVLAKCECGGVEFTISQPGDGGKWPGRHCACNSCRLSTSCPVSSWIAVPNVALALHDGSKFPSDGVFGTGKIYHSSEGVKRSFCKTCGASVAVVRDGEPGVVQIAAGLLRVRGVRAKKWVDWSDVVSGLEDAKLKSVVESFTRSLSGRTRESEST